MSGAAEHPAAVRVVRAGQRGTRRPARRTPRPVLAHARRALRRLEAFWNAAGLDVPGGYQQFPTCTHVDEIA